ncbi:MULTISPECIES: CotH kinase family protein [Lactobacillus]|uniref:BppU N-terminal domain-containing protein n=2 Tax=Lactobacillus TaxID=1578 RepID=A0A256LCD8_9LACO|nr:MULTISPECIES: CotH kinase family protein [Lactobacillus]MTE02766.1 hypothetical protein [Lactobacillus johnsonii]OYR87453.1 hypothetical protein CBF53_08425 [Lactobacillus taiwanensis]OYR91071.1 hypothetical protein CBF70_07860 [Lactobacillus taiwanensis]OYR92533.1 hypothetical protein CBF59_03650 [Lactobacillus taiwanensis]OYR94480.1 hypothetical protein CBF58_08635 [Lactobacillus taiwanensis]
MDLNIVNGGKPYFFRFDVAKEAGEIARITDYLKTRVSDNGKKVPIKWFDQGQEMNVHGMSPFIQGGVGHYIKDDNGEMLPSSDVVYREWYGTPADVTDDGVVYYTLEDQFFCKQGEFNGFFGLRDSQGNVLTSVNIVFQILGNDLRITKAKEFYIDELENLKNKFKNDGDQAVKDFNAKIEAGTENNRTALNALSASIQANRDGQANIAEQQAAITRQINDQDIITKKEYESNIATVKASINERLSQMKTAPVGVDNYQTLINTYPNGADGIFLALDSKHIWMWLNGQWKDCGVYQSAGLDQEVQQSIGDTRSIVLKENLIENGSFSAGTTQPAYSNTGTGELSLFQFLNRTWLNFVSESETAFQGVSYNFKNPILTSGINYPMHFEFDLISKELITLSINLIGYDATGNRIGGASGGQTLGTVTLYPWRMKHEVINADISASFADAQTLCLQIIQTAAKPIGTLRMTGVCANLILSSDPMPTGNLINNSLLELGLNNGAYSNTNSGNLGVMRQFVGRNWLRLTTNYAGSYNGISWNVDNPLKTLGQNCPLHIAFDLMTQDRTKLAVNVIPKNLDGTFYNNETGITINSIESLPWKLFQEDMTALLPDSYVTADKLTFQIVQNDPKPISDLRMTDIKFKVAPLQDKYTGNLIINDNYTPGNVFSAYKNAGTGSINKMIFTNKEWVDYMSSAQAPWQGLNWKVKNPISDLGMKYPLSLSFILGSDIERTLSVNFIGYDASGNRIGGDSGGQTLKTIHTQPWKFVDYNIEFNINDLYINSKYFVLQIVQADNKELAHLRITDLELKMNYSLQDNSLSSDISKLEQKYNLPIMRITGDTNGMTHDNAKNITYQFKNGRTYLEGHGTIKWQGSSSSTLAKKGYRLKTTQADYDKKNKIRIQPSWQKHHKYNLKAYYNDGMLSRDPISANIGGQVSASRPTLPRDLIHEDNFGYIDGFPIVLFINNQYQGLYSFNLPRPEFSYTKWAIMGNQYNDTTQFIKIPADGVKLDGSDFETLNPEDTPTADEKKAVTDLINWAINSDDATFKKELSQHFNIPSLIDYIVVANILGARDASGKNQILMTWDGKIWYYQLYDLDCTYNANWMGGKTFDTPKVGTELPFLGNNKFLLRFARLYKKAIADRYRDVRQWCTPGYVLSLYKQRINLIGQGNFEEEWTLWNDPSKDTEDFKQLQNDLYDHFKAADYVWLGNNPENTTYQIKPDSEYSDQIQNLQNQINQLKNNGTTK